MMRKMCLRQASPARWLPIAKQLRPSLASFRSFTSGQTSSVAVARGTLLPESRPTSMPSLSYAIQKRGYAERTVQVPEMAESISEGTLKQFSKSVGDYVEQDEEIATIETDKIDVAVNAPEAGVITEFLAKEEDTVTVGQDLVKIDTEGKASSSGSAEAKSEPKEPASSEQKTSSQPEGGREEETSTPKKEEKAETSQQASSPPKSQDKQPTPKPQDKQPASRPQKDSQPKQSTQPNTAAGGSGSRGENRVKMNRMRLRIAERLKQSQNTAASLTTFQKVDMSSLMEFRKLYKEDILKKTGVKLGFMSAFTRASVLAMKDIPAVNASIEGPNGGDTIVYRDYVDISVAVATEKGLVTPVVRNVESLDLIGIESAIAELGKKARDNKLTIEDMAGGSFTISNGGVFGSLFGTPIINLPQTAVLGLHAINEEVVSINGKFEARPIMYLALTYDHRLLDGREAVTFLVKVKQYIEDPRRMLLG